MISIHQPQFLPWVPYFNKMLNSDLFVVLDNVQFQKNGVQNRNKIKTPRGALWLTVPVVSRFGASLNQMEVADTRSYSKLLKTLKMNYGQSEFFNQIYAPIQEVFDRMLPNLNELNLALLEKVMGIIGEKPEIRFSSDVPTVNPSTHSDLKAGACSGLTLSGTFTPALQGGDWCRRRVKTKDDLIIDIIKYFEQKEYLSGPGALEYMDLSKFKKAGIKVYVTEFKYAEYRQLWNKQVGFLPELSIIDLLFNNAANAAAYIRKNGGLKNVA